MGYCHNLALFAMRKQAQPERTEKTDKRAAAPVFATGTPNLKTKKFS